MQVTLHATRRTPHGASRLVQAVSAWLVETRRAPSWHSRDARVHYGHAQTEYTHNTGIRTHAHHRLSDCGLVESPVDLFTNNDFLSSLHLFCFSH